MKVLPLSMDIWFAVGSWYLGCRGSTTLLVLNSCALGRAPSISSIFKGSLFLLICLYLLGMGSTKVESAKLLPACYLETRDLGRVPSISLFWKVDSLLKSVLVAKSFLADSTKKSTYR